ncbi:MAG: neutral/alkaline non-lysosomal ceramidase N-terminal domain-containing protein [bacterium]|nr:neutral/alkaline non-lysosomal ceramidase N-terminal domain-containing protein [bacterium]
MPELLVGYGEKTITPPLGVELTGYGYYLNRKAETVMDDLKARVLFIRQDGNDVILISCDLLGMTVEYADAVRAEISSRYGMHRQNILLACAHTHTGPAVQSLPGLGETDSDYISRLPADIIEAVKSAESDLTTAEASCCRAEVEAICFNRRNMSPEPVDPVLRSVIFKRANEKIYLVNYACHPVTLGPSNSVSADWPGALIAALEDNGHRGIFFQGFCGDIDPLCNLSRWGSGKKEAMDAYGRMLCRGLGKAEKSAEVLLAPVVKAAERRLTLRLTIPSREEMEMDKQFWLQQSTGFTGSADKRFVEEWAMCAEENYDRLQETPYLTDVPVQAVSIGAIKMLCLPGEVFCNYGLRLHEEQPSLITIGYANGNIGYLPTTDAYADAGDYACYGAPKFYNLFPFAAEIESILLAEGRALLTTED